MTATATNTRLMTSIDEIRQRNAANGGNWFHPDVRKHFRTHVSTAVYPCEANGGTYFVSSENYGEHLPRYYTVRWADPSGVVCTVGRYMEYRSRNGAHSAARLCAGRATAVSAG